MCQHYAVSVITSVRLRAHPGIKAQDRVEARGVSAEGPWAELVLCRTSSLFRVTGVRAELCSGRTGAQCRDRGSGQSQAEAGVRAQGNCVW